MGYQREVLSPRPPVLGLSTLTTWLTITLLTRDPGTKVIDADWIQESCVDGGEACLADAHVCISNVFLELMA